MLREKIRHHISTIPLYQVRYNTSNYFKRSVDSLIEEDVDERHIIILINSLCKILEEKDYEINNLKINKR